jgi:hypothetical protein
VLSAQNAAMVLSRCQHGDDQACPLALEQLQHECGLGVEQRCRQAHELLRTWLARRDENWANARCARGQFAACVLGGAAQLQRCENAELEACRALLGRLGAAEDLARLLETSSARIKLRICELDPAARDCEHTTSTKPQPELRIAETAP